MSGCSLRRGDREGPRTPRLAPLDEEVISDEKDRRTATQNTYPYYMVKVVLALRLVNLKPTLTNSTAVIFKTVDIIYTSGKIFFISCTSGHVHASCRDSTYIELSSGKCISLVDKGRHLSCRVIRVDNSSCLDSTYRVVEWKCISLVYESEDTT